MEVFIPRQLLITECCICLEVKSTINQPCGLTKHKACLSCIEKILIKIPISRDNPHFTCQYPFGDCGEIYSTSFLKKILGERYLLYEKSNKIYLYDDYLLYTCPSCNKLLAEDEDENIKRNRFETSICCSYCDFIFCTVCNEECCSSICSLCIGFNIINPREYNSFFYKKTRDNYCDYKIRNNEITVELALEQIMEKINYKVITCPICLTKLYKSEKCNGLKHCHIEICYSCGMFSEIAEELNDHWSAVGKKGCPRWDTDPIIKNNIKDYKCIEDTCFSHESGDCMIEDHKSGIESKKEFILEKYVYHSLKSLLPRIRYSVINLLPEHYKNLISSESWDYLDNNGLSIANRDDY